MENQMTVRSSREAGRKVRRVNARAKEVRSLKMRIFRSLRIGEEERVFEVKTKVLILKTTATEEGFCFERNETWNRKA